MQFTMELKGYKAQIMEAERLVGNHVHALPPGKALPVYYSDEFIKWPENWIKKSFLVPVRPNKGLWFNFRDNSEINTAVIMTVRGCNPITGLQTTGFHLEKYESKCPKHGCDFLADRFCPECNYKWPDRGYLSGSPLWFDGYRADDGSVRQFFFTEDELRDVSTRLIGKENAVPAFGFAFYSPKERRPEPVAETYRGSSTWYGGEVKLGSPHGCWGINGTGLLSDVNWNYTLTNTTVNHVYLTNSAGVSNTGSITGAQSQGTRVSASASDQKKYGYMVPDSHGQTKGGSHGQTKGVVRSKNLMSNVTLESLEVKTDGNVGLGDAEPRAVKEVSVGAGARINQILPVDGYGLDTWKDTPDSVMTVYFVFQEAFDQMKAGGMRDLEGAKEGFLQECIVG